MKPPMIVGLALVVVGVLVLVFQGTSYTKPDTSGIDAAKLAAENQEVVPVLPIIGALSMASGIFLLVIGSRK